MTEALVVIHLSSLDSYADAAHDLTGHWLDAEELAENLSEAILTHAGPVYIVDQNWLFIGRESRPRDRLLDAIEPRKDIVWIEFDEQMEEPGWSRFLRTLVRRLKKDRITSVRLGGVWFDPELKIGCVTYTYRFLRKFLSTIVDRSIVGCEEDFAS